jgi:hypothetical protein
MKKWLNTLTVFWYLFNKLCYLLATDDDSATTANQPVQGSYSTGSSRQEWIITAIESRNRYYFTGFIDGRVSKCEVEYWLFHFSIHSFVIYGRGNLWNFVVLSWVGYLSVQKKIIGICFCKFLVGGVFFCSFF